MSEPTQSEKGRRCPIVASGTNEQCALDVNHNSPHRSKDGALTWQPLYVADLERALADERNSSWKWLLVEVLDEIGDSLHSGAIDEARERIASALDGENMPVDEEREPELLDAGEGNR